MADTLGDRFAAALRNLEKTRDLDSMVAAFDPKATLSRIPQHHEFRGEDGARRFWQQYLHVFDTVETTFTNVVDAGSRAALEWRSRGRLHSGVEVEYEGASIVEAGDDGRIISFSTYYDAGAILGHHRGVQHSPEPRA